MAAVSEPSGSPRSAGKRNVVLWILGGLLFLFACFAATVWLMLKYGGYLLAMVPAQVPVELTHLPKAAERLAAAKDPDSRWYVLADAAMWAVHKGQIEDAEQLANELLKESDIRRDWNTGNAVHKGNLVLGRVALQRGDVVTARERLLAAGRTSGSPQLDTFGPNMTLAAEMLKRGEKATVLEYLDLCAKFWKMDNGSLAAWRLMIRNDRMPNFGAHLVY